MAKWGREYSHLSSEKAMKIQVLHTVRRNIHGEAVEQTIVDYTEKTCLLSDDLTTAKKLLTLWNWCATANSLVCDFHTHYWAAKTQSVWTFKPENWANVTHLPCIPECQYIWLLSRPVPSRLVTSSRLEYYCLRGAETVGCKNSSAKKVWIDIQCWEPNPLVGSSASAKTTGHCGSVSQSDSDWWQADALYQSLVIGCRATALRRSTNRDFDCSVEYFPGITVQMVMTLDIAKA